VNASQNGKRNGIFAPKIYYYSQPKKIWYGGVERTRDKWVFRHIGQGTIEKEEPCNSIIETEYACGCALFISADMVNKVGLFDERFFLMFEETDLCYRARRIGIKSFLVPEAKVWHKISISFGGGNSPKFHYFFMRNKLLFAHKHLNFSERILIYKNVFKEIARYVTPGNYKNPINRAKLLGIKDYLLRNYGNCPPSI
jgi:GT2 family glycosyltransferase